MKPIPKMEWFSLREWASDSGVDYETAKEIALSSLEIEFVPTIDGGFVRVNPIPKKKPGLVKISKSDQPPTQAA